MTHTKSRAIHASRNPHSYEQFYLECITGFYLLLSIFLIVSLAVRVKKRGAILWIINAGTSNWSWIATFNAESICFKPVSWTSFRCSLHSLLNILFLKFYIDSIKHSQCQADFNHWQLYLLTHSTESPSVILYDWLIWLPAIPSNPFNILRNIYVNWQWVMNK